MATTPPSSTPLPLQAEQTLPASLASLSSLSTLWIPLEETTQQWAAFAHEALTVSAQQAVSTAFGGLAWETKALRHYTWAISERERGRQRKEASWLKRAVQDLDCALDQWQQVVNWLELASSDDYQQPGNDAAVARTGSSAPGAAACPAPAGAGRIRHREAAGAHASPTGSACRKAGETMVTAELLWMMIAWLLVAIVLSFLLWVLVLIWGQLIQALKTWFGGTREELSQPPDHYQVPVYPPLQQDGYSRRDVP